MDDLLFRVTTPLGITVVASRRYWEQVILEKHPVLRGRDEAVRSALEDPDSVRRSRKDPAVLLFYRGESLLITAYPTDSIKIGEPAWPRLH